MELSKEQLIDSLRDYKSRQDNLLHDDLDTFEPNLKRFVDFCQIDPLIQIILQPLKSKYTIDSDLWWKQLTSDNREVGDLCLPKEKDEELLLRYTVINDVDKRNDLIRTFGWAFGKHKSQEGIELFRSLIFRPFAEEMSHRLGQAIDLATPEERALQAVPLKYIPSPKEIRIFLSHKSVDEPLVKRYDQILKELGYSPWFAESILLAGSNLERELLQGFEESCAAVFFITSNFKDENYIATEVEYAVMQKRKKKDKFAIIVLCYENAKEVPGLLQPYIYKTISNDLDGFYELVRALPVRVGPIRWKPGIVKE